MSIYKYGNRGLVLAAAAVLMLSRSAFAGEVVELDLQQAMERAFATHPDLKIASYERDYARSNYNAARESFGISITGTHSTNRGGYNDYQEVIPGIYSKGIGNKYANGLSVSLPIFTGGKLEGNAKQAEASYRIAEVGIQKAYNEMRSNVTNSYFSVLQADNMQQLGKESVQRLEDHLKNVNAQYEVGVVAKVDVLRSEVELAGAQQSLLKAENAYHLAEANLNRVVGLPLDTTLKLQYVLNYTPYDKDLKYCLDYAAEHRPELEQARQKVNVYKGALQIARSGHMPTVALGATQNWDGTDWPGDDNGKWGVGVNVSLNIFDSGVTLSKIHGAEANLHSAEEAYRNTVDTVNLDVRSNYLSLREAEKRIKTTEMAVAKAEEDFRIAQLSYRAGVATNTDVLDAQVALTDAKNNYFTAMYDYNTAKTNLLTSIGEPMAVPIKVETSVSK
ncbi:MAG: TolC family protein [Acidaminococcaceae bacterium]|nr:TolC family protein [Acidaminococcaceae bacterium]